MSDNFIPEIRPAREVPDNPATRSSHLASKYHFHLLCVGDAYILPADHDGAVAGKRGQTRVANAASQFNRARGVKIKTRRQADGSVRVERVK